jgi:hypothetical protein
LDLACAAGSLFGREEESMPIRIDLRKLRDPLVTQIRDSLQAFASKNLTLKICTIALFGDGFHGSASLHLDTPEHSAAFVQKTDWFGEDDQGRFCNNCWDFAHCIGEYTFRGYPDLYQNELEEPVEYINLNGTKSRSSSEEGDEGNHRIIFPFLKGILASFQPFPQLSCIEPFRVGVQMRDSTYVEFWRNDMQPDTSVPPAEIVDDDDWISGESSD